MRSVRMNECRASFPATGLDELILKIEWQNLRKSHIGVVRAKVHVQAIGKKGVLLEKAALSTPG